MGATTRKPIGTHYVIRLVVEQIKVTGEFGYQETEAMPGTFDRRVSELGNIIIKDHTLDAAISKATRCLDLIGE